MFYRCERLISVLQYSAEPFPVCKSFDSEDQLYYKLEKGLFYREMFANSFLRDMSLSNQVKLLLEKFPEYAEKVSVADTVIESYRPQNEIFSVAVWPAVGTLVQWSHRYPLPVFLLLELGHALAVITAEAGEVVSVLVLGENVHWFDSQCINQAQALLQEISLTMTWTQQTQQPVQVGQPREEGGREAKEEVSLLVAWSLRLVVIVRNDSHAAAALRELELLLQSERKKELLQSIVSWSRLVRNLEFRKQRFEKSTSHKVGDYSNPPIPASRLSRRDQRDGSDDCGGFMFDGKVSGAEDLDAVLMEDTLRQSLLVLPDDALGVTNASQTMDHLTVLTVNDAATASPFPAASRSPGPRQRPDSRSDGDVKERRSQLIQPPSSSVPVTAFSVTSVEEACWGDRPTCTRTRARRQEVKDEYEGEESVVLLQLPETSVSIPVPVSDTTPYTTRPAKSDSHQQEGMEINSSISLRNYQQQLQQSSLSPQRSPPFNPAEASGRDSCLTSSLNAMLLQSLEGEDVSSFGMRAYLAIRNKVLANGMDYNPEEEGEGEEEFDDYSNNMPDNYQREDDDQYPSLTHHPATATATDSQLLLHLQSKDKDRDRGIDKDKDKDRGIDKEGMSRQPSPPCVAPPTPNEPPLRPSQTPFATTTSTKSSPRCSGPLPPDNPWSTAMSPTLSLSKSQQQRQRLQTRRGIFEDSPASLVPANPGRHSQPLDSCTAPAGVPDATDHPLSLAPIEPKDLTSRKAEVDYRSKSGSENFIGNVPEPDLGDENDEEVEEIEDIQEVEVEEDAPIITYHLGASMRSPVLSTRSQPHLQYYSSGFHEETTVTRGRHNQRPHAPLYSDLQSPYRVKSPLPNDVAASSAGISTRDDQEEEEDEEVASAESEGQGGSESPDAHSSGSRGSTRSSQHLLFDNSMTASTSLETHRKREELVYYNTNSPSRGPALSELRLYDELIADVLASPYRSKGQLKVGRQGDEGGGDIFSSKSTIGQAGLAARLSEYYEREGEQLSLLGLRGSQGGPSQPPEYRHEASAAAPSPITCSRDAPSDRLLALRLQLRDRRGAIEGRRQQAKSELALRKQRRGSQVAARLLRELPNTTPDYHSDVTSENNNDNNKNDKNKKSSYYHDDGDNTGGSHYLSTEPVRVVAAETSYVYGDSVLMNSDAADNTKRQFSIARQAARNPSDVVNTLAGQSSASVLTAKSKSKIGVSGLRAVLAEGVGEGEESTANIIATKESSKESDVTEGQSVQRLSAAVIHGPSQFRSGSQQRGRGSRGEASGRGDSTGNFPTGIDRRRSIANGSESRGSDGRDIGEAYCDSNIRSNSYYHDQNKEDEQSTGNLEPPTPPAAAERPSRSNGIHIVRPAHVSAVPFPLSQLVGGKSSDPAMQSHPHRPIDPNSMVAPAVRSEQMIATPSAPLDSQLVVEDNYPPKVKGGLKLDITIGAGEEEDEKKSRAAKFERLREKKAREAHQREIGRDRDRDKAGKVTDHSNAKRLSEDPRIVNAKIDWSDNSDEKSREAGQGYVYGRDKVKHENKPTKTPQSIATRERISSNNNYHDVAELSNAISDNKMGKRGALDPQLNNEQKIPLNKRPKSKGYSKANDNNEYEYATEVGSMNGRLEYPSDPPVMAAGAGGGYLLQHELKRAKGGRDPSRNRDRDMSPDNSSSSSRQSASVSGSKASARPGGGDGGGSQVSARSGSRSRGGGGARERPESVGRGGGGMSRIVTKPVSNHQQVKNALCNVCLAGTHFDSVRTEVLSVLEKHNCNSVASAGDAFQENEFILPEPTSTTISQFIILLVHSETLAYKGLYALEGSDTGYLRKLCGKTPKVIPLDMVQDFFKYESSSRSFKKLGTRSITGTTDAVSVDTAKLKRFLGLG